MFIKTAAKSENVGQQFWGCSDFPKHCNYINVRLQQRRAYEKAKEAQEIYDLESEINSDEAALVYDSKPCCPLWARANSHG
jgi:hypothetical protein